MAELFIELFSEEIPAKLQIDARKRIKEMLVTIEITMIQETPDVDTEPGSFRSKGTSLLILKGEFIDEVDDNLKSLESAVVFKKK